MLSAFLHEKPALEQDRFRHAQDAPMEHRTHLEREPLIQLSPAAPASAPPLAPPPRPMPSFSP